MMELWPFTNFHDLNLDWIIKTIKTYTKKVDDFTENMTNTWDTFRNFVNHEIAEMHRKFAIYVNVTEGALNTGAIADGAITEPKIESNFLKEIKNPFITPQMFGAVGDGVTDDTSAFNDMFQYVYDDVSTTTPAVIVIPPYKYHLTDTLEFTKSTVYAYGSVLEFNCSNETLISFKQKNSSWTYECVINGLTIDTTERTNLSNIGIDLSNTSQFIFKDLSIFHCNHAIYTHNTSMITMDRPTIEYCENGITLNTQTNNIYIEHANMYENFSVFNFTGGYVSDLYVTDSYFEENEIDVLSDTPTAPYGYNNIVFERINIVKANLTSNTNDTYVFKTVAPASGSGEMSFTLIGIRTNFVPGLRQHHFADNDAKSNSRAYITFRSNRIHVYYTSAPAAQEVIFKTSNSAYYQASLISNATVFNENYMVENSGYLRSGIDNAKWNNIVRQQLTFLGAPVDEQNKSLFYSPYTDRLQFKNGNGDRKDIVAGNKETFTRIPDGATIADVITRFNDLLTVLTKFDILVKQ